LTGRVGDAAVAGGATDDTAGEMDFDALDNVSMAGARFEWIQRRLSRDCKGAARYIAFRPEFGRCRRIPRLNM
jgi:hypothetical protein